MTNVKQICIPKEIDDKIEIVAKNLGVSKSEVIRLCIIKELERVGLLNPGDKK
ncbi:MAG: hypothetical protein QXI58_08090 [Candidatus Micrarchaeia archaeon]